ncbi:hypothetical protein SH2C18_21500 [Clostridium sediminicola]|uniref:type IV pilus assembly protein PilM n=1 Tax=Clostridium sediminicola TaxID=3114879 RepID=UPI0031F2020A
MTNLFNNCFLTMEFGSNSVKILESKMKGKKIFVNKSSIIELSQDVIKDGKIENIEEIREVLKNVFETGKFTAKKVNITIKSSSVISRNILTPKANEKDMDTMVKYEVEDQLPVNAMDYEIKYKMLGQKTLNDEVLNEVNVILFPKKIAKEYWELINYLKLKPKVLNLNSNAIEKLFSTRNIKLKREYSDSEGIFVIIDIGFKNIELNIISEGSTQFSRILSGGGKYLDNIIYNEMLDDEEKKQEFKKKYADLMYDINKTDPSVAEINDSIKAEVDRWIKDIDRVIDYYMNQNKEKKLEHIYIHGGTANVKGLTHYMEQYLNVSVSIIELRNIKSSDLKFNKNYERYINIIGATIR